MILGNDAETKVTIPSEYSRCPPGESMTRQPSTPLLSTKPSNLLPPPSTSATDQASLSTSSAFHVHLYSTFSTSMSTTSALHTASTSPSDSMSLGTMTSFAASSSGKAVKLIKE